MKLILSIVMCPAGSNMEGQQYQFDAAGGTFGRAPDNSWVLPDPSRYVSSKHAEIKFEHNQFKLVDCSTNGTYLNDGVEPLGMMNQPMLKQGDTLQLGDYRLQVSVELATPATASPAGDATQMLDAAPAAAGAGNALDDLDKWLEPAAPAPASTPVSSPQPIASSTSVSSGGIGIDLGLKDEEKDPLAALGMGAPESVSTPDAGGVLSDLIQETPPLDQQMMKVPTAIPDDWDDLLGGPDSSPAPSPAPVATPAPATQPIETPASAAPVTAASDPDATTFLSDAQLDVPAPTASAAIPTQDDQALDDFLSAPAASADVTQLNEPVEVAATVSATASATASAAPQAPTPEVPKQTTVSAGAVTVDAQSLAQELGLQLNDEQLANLNASVAETLKSMVGGMMQTLRARSEVKSEFRMNMTTIQSAENNPLKFSVTPEDALENMFAKSGKAYLSPVESVADGFADIADHQLALFEAMRAAYDNILNQFNPKTLEAKFENAKGKGLLSGGKGKNWELFNGLFDEYQQDTEATFKRLFGEVFADAYERRMHSLKMNRKK